MNTSDPSTTGNDDVAPRAVDWENPRVAAILAAALKCFAQKGFDSTTLAEIGKELGLRKSIVHYYFASKAALIHEVQSFTQQKYVERVTASLQGSGEQPKARAMNALRSLWQEVKQNRTETAVNIEVWSAARRDPELKRRAAALHRNARQLVSSGIGDVLGVSVETLPFAQPLTTLILAVVNGLAIADYLEGDDPQNDAAFETFLFLLKLGIQALQDGKIRT